MLLQHNTFIIPESCVLFLLRPKLRFISVFYVEVWSNISPFFMHHCAHWFLQPLVSLQEYIALPETPELYPTRLSHARLYIHKLLSLPSFPGDLNLALCLILYPSSAGLFIVRIEAWTLLLKEHTSHKKQVNLRDYHSAVNKFRKSQTQLFPVEKNQCHHQKSLHEHELFLKWWNQFRSLTTISLA